MNAQLDTFLNHAETFARLLLLVESVTDIGIFGSVARGIPKEGKTHFGDLDMILFVDSPEIAEDFNRAYLRPVTLLDLTRYIPNISDTLYTELTETNRDCARVQFIVLPLIPNPDFVKRFCQMQQDRYFLDNIFTDMKMFDLKRGGFGPVGNFPQEWFSIAQTSYFPPCVLVNDELEEDMEEFLEKILAQDEASNHRVRAMADNAGSGNLARFW